MMVSLGLGCKEDGALAGTLRLVRESELALPCVSSSVGTVLAAGSIRDWGGRAPEMPDTGGRVFSFEGALVNDFDLIVDAADVLDKGSSLLFASSSCVVGFGGVGGGMDESWTNGCEGRMGLGPPLQVDKTPPPLSIDADRMEDLDLELCLDCWAALADWLSRWERL